MEKQSTCRSKKSCCPIFLKISAEAYRIKNDKYNTCIVSDSKLKQQSTKMQGSCTIRLLQYIIIFIFIFSLFFNLLCILPLQLQYTEYFSFICVSNYSTWYKYSTLLQKLFPFSFSLYWHHSIPCIKWAVPFQKIMFPCIRTSILENTTSRVYISKKCNFSIYLSVPGG
jgi:hypothetical protein